MKKFVVLASTLAVMAMSGSVNAEESDRHATAQEIRRILNDVWDKLDSADPEHHGHFSPDMMRISATKDPVDWSIQSAGLASKEEFVEWAGEWAETWANNPDWQRTREILRVNLKDDRALVTARQTWSMPDSTRLMTINGTMSEVILFRKIKKSWNLTHSFVVNQEQSIWHWNPK